MRITLCGSVAFIHEMDALRGELEKLGHEVKLPPTHKPGPDGSLIPTLEYYQHKKAAVGDANDWIWENHGQAIKDHYIKIDWCEAVVIANYDKNGITGYVGPNTLIEMGLAFYQNKPIFLLQPIPDVPYKEEILGMRPIVIHNDLSSIA